MSDATTSLGRTTFARAPFATYDHEDNESESECDCVVLVHSVDIVEMNPGPGSSFQVLDGYRGDIGGPVDCMFRSISYTVGGQPTAQQLRIASMLRFSQLIAAGDVSAHAHMHSILNGIGPVGCQLYMPDASPMPPVPFLGTIDAYLSRMSLPPSAGGLPGDRVALHYCALVVNKRIVVVDASDRVVSELNPSAEQRIHLRLDDMQYMPVQKRYMGIAEWDSQIRDIVAHNNIIYWRLGTKDVSGSGPTRGYAHMLLYGYKCDWHIPQTATNCHKPCDTQPHTRHSEPLTVCVSLRLSAAEASE